MARRVDNESQKRKSRDAARQRRGQQNDEFTELAGQLPIPHNLSLQLDRLCVMRLSNSFVKMKHIIRQVTGEMRTIKEEPNLDMMMPDLSLLDALDGFVFVVSQDGQCLYVSPNVSQYLGISQLEITGCSFYKYVHPCDQEELAQQLGGQVPLEDMEIFDGLFCSDLPSVFKDCQVKPKYKKKHSDADKYRSFFIRMKSTLTSRGKSVNLSASIYRVIHSIGKVQNFQTRFGTANNDTDSKFLIAVGTPLLAAPTFDVPLDRSTFTTTHTLDLRLIALEDIAFNLMGYSERELMDKSWYNYIHTNDIDIVRKCHDLMLSKGQAVSGFYRVMTKMGGWIWMLTKGNIVYSNTTFQPQYIININYAVSGVEEPEQLLSTEQMQSVIKMSAAGFKRTRALPMEDSGSPFKFRKECLIGTSASRSDCDSSEENLAISGMEELESLQRNQEKYESLLVEQYAQSVDGDSNIEAELPSLEELGSDQSLSSNSSVAGDLATESELLFRAPFVMQPSSDQMLFLPGSSPITLIDDDQSSDNGNFEEFAARAPFIPPPNDDTILTFEDLPDSPLPFITGFDGTDPISKMPELYLEEELFDEKMMAVGPASVPSSLVLINSAKNPTAGSGSASPNIPGKAGKGVSLSCKRSKSSLPWISTSEAEFNAPSGSLLHGFELLSALEKNTAT